MGTKRLQLAKLTRPRLHKAVARERLFGLLDEAREHNPAICVVGPPGAGKTTLVERFGNGGRKAFGSSDELWAFLTKVRPARKGAGRVKSDKEQR